MKKESINRYIQRLTNEQSSINEQLHWMENLEKEPIKKIDSVNSLILGLAVGIVGNFFAQFAYSSLENVTIRNFNLFYVSITGLVISLIILLCIVRHYFQQRKMEMQYVDDNLAKGKSALRVRLANIPFEIEDLKKELETNP